jgi:hypothetical protein
MAISYTQHTLDKLEHLLKSLDYKVRYEKGNFRTGACILENSKVIVVNRFSDIDTKINALIGMLRELDENGVLLDDKEKELLFSLKHISA